MNQSMFVIAAATWCKNRGFVRQSDEEKNGPDSEQDPAKNITSGISRSCRLQRVLLAEPMPLT
jgi:hypothetical protein